MINILQAITNDLPNFPEQIIQNWLLPITKEIGWSPKHNENWYNIPMNGSIDYWRSMVWEKQIIEFNNLRLTNIYHVEINEMANNYYKGIDSVYNSCKRIKYSINLIKNKKLLKPIILISSNNGYEIADGNHRITAYKISRDKNIINNPKLETWVGTTDAYSGTFYWSTNGR
jgi:hypothetical protein